MPRHVLRVKKIGAYEYLYLVENAREGGRHVQRVIKALGRRDEVEASGLIERLERKTAADYRRTWRAWRALILAKDWLQQPNPTPDQKLTLHPPICIGLRHE